MAKTKFVTQIRLDEVTYAKVKALSSKELRSINAQMEYFIVKGIEEYERTHGELSLSEAND